MVSKPPDLTESSEMAFRPPRACRRVDERRAPLYSSVAFCSIESELNTPALACPPRAITSGGAGLDADGASYRWHMDVAVTPE